MTCATVTPMEAYQATAALRWAMALTAFSFGWISVRDNREASSVQTCTYSRPIPRLFD